MYLQCYSLPAFQQRSQFIFLYMTKIELNPDFSSLLVTRTKGFKPVFVSLGGSTNSDSTVSSVSRWTWGFKLLTKPKRITTLSQYDQTLTWTSTCIKISTWVTFLASILIQYLIGNLEVEHLQEKKENVAHFPSLPSLLLHLIYVGSSSPLGSRLTRSSPLHASLSKMAAVRGGEWYIQQRAQ